jgi:hypothetical protein
MGQPVFLKKATTQKVCCLYVTRRGRAEGREGGGRSPADAGCPGYAGLIRLFPGAPDSSGSSRVRRIHPALPGCAGLIRLFPGAPD